MSAKMLLPAGVFAGFLAVCMPVAADVVDLRPDHPERYVVQKGDTLWDISKRFLRNPWRWASIWKINQQIKNPHLIYPGDVILLTYVDGQPQLTVERGAPPPERAPETAPPTAAEVVEEPAGVTPDGMKVVRLKPRIYTERIEEAIPTIPPNVIVPFLTEAMVVSPGELERAGYVAVGLDDRVALGDGSEFYARGLRRNQAEYFQVFRPGPALRHPQTGELLAYEAHYLGDARLLEPGDPAKLVVTRVKQEILPTDRLLAAPERAALPYYFPRAPERKVEGRILSVLNGVNVIGPNAVVTISLGRRDGIEEGHVLRIMRHVGTRRDPVTRRDFRMPDEESGLLMVFRVFDKVSYALITDAVRPVSTADVLRTP